MDTPESNTESRFDLITWLDVNKIPLAFGVLALGFLGLVYVIYDTQTMSTEQTATRELLRIQLKEEPASSADYLAVYNDHSGTAASRQSLLMAASRAFAEGEIEKSRELFREFVNSNPESGSIPQAQMGIAASFEAEERWDEALEQYQQISTRYPNHPLTPRSKLSQARLYLQMDQPEQALQIYQDVTSQNLASAMGQPAPWMQKARQEQAALLMEHPELAPTNTPSASLPSELGPMIPQPTNQP